MIERELIKLIIDCNLPSTDHYLSQLPELIEKHFTVHTFHSSAYWGCSSRGSECLVQCVIDWEKNKMIGTLEYCLHENFFITKN